MSQTRDILLHTCCAVCLEAVLPALEDEGFSVTAFFFNPNIHPYREFMKRLRAVEVSAESHKTPLIADKEYGLALYVDEILPHGAGRCRACYSVRMKASAQAAARVGACAFTTTLLASSHQKHELVASVAETEASAAGVEFLYRDWRPRLDAGIEAARRRSLYRQHYCGCIWSEYERFGPKPDGAGE